MRIALLASLIAIILVGSIAASIFLVTKPSPQTFVLSVFPNQLRGDAIAGQRVVLLVTVANSESGQNGGSVEVFASAPGSILGVEPSQIVPGQIGEVTLIPDLNSVGKNISVVVRAERDEFTRVQSLNFTVVPGEDTLGDRARQLRGAFIRWLEVNHSELGITTQTQWLGTIVSPRWLVVSHYLFFSTEWEMHVYWHVMIPPYDWARIDLRHRLSQLTPSLSFEISSINASQLPRAITPPETTWR